MASSPLPSACERPRCLTRWQAGHSAAKPASRCAGAPFGERDLARAGALSMPPDAAPGKRRRVPLESPRASYRWFVNAEGIERCHRFERGESRALTPANLGRQLAAAEYPERVAFDPGSRSPR